MDRGFDERREMWRLLGYLAVIAVTTHHRHRHLPGSASTRPSIKAYG
jgi:hypothetical protein